MSKFISNSFQVPNAVIDELMADMSANALRCYLLITRKTTGWGKTSDKISISQFMQYLGIKDKRTVYAALSELTNLGLINAIKNNGEITEYSLVLETSEPVAKNVGTKNVTGSKKCMEPVAKNVTTTSDKKCHSTKDTIKNNITKENNIDFDLVMDAYNDAVENRLPQIQKMTTARKNAVKKLLKELDQPTFQNLANYFYDFVDHAKPFYFGENDRGWRADFDYIIKPSTYLKVVEGTL
ncbi:replication protein [Gilliamella sp. ESL0232]|uniref:replication protein n=1 Tax=Gilliamella sp. ESL0232 TaxID=2705037 RepID=UPI001580406C|nr:replication protein [Gilliamella sp. ESL0232]NUE95413.1 replication protein [Gilliamella sp. ESL0232]